MAATHGFTVVTLGTLVAYWQTGRRKYVLTHR